MKYNLPTEKIPQGDRKEINEKILYLIDSNQCKENDISEQDVFNSYTGKGGLHDLDFKDFNNYHEYSSEKKIIEMGQFFTPAKICKFIISCVKPSDTDLVADLCMGMGNFFNFCPNEFNVFGTEIDTNAFKVAKHLYPNANLLNEDIRLYDPKIKFDIVFGNPPFGLKWTHQKEQYLSQYYYFIKAEELLNPAGILALIVPSSFLKDEFMNNKMIAEIDERFNFIAQIEIPKNSFKDVGVASFETKIMFFQKKSENIPEVKYTPFDDIVTPGLNDYQSQIIHDGFIKPLLEHKKKIHAKLLLERNNNESPKEKEFNFKVKKLLWDIKDSKHTKKKYAKALGYVNEYHNQKMPKDIDYEEWEKIRITEKKVLTFLKKILRNQHLIERDEIRLVKDNYGLRLKAYSGKAHFRLNNHPNKKMTFTDMVLNNNYPFVDLTYKMLINKKTVSYQKNEVKFKDLGKSDVGNIIDWIASNPIHDYSKNQDLKLTEIQSLETAKMIYKGLGILDFEMGSGKSLCAIQFYRYLRPKTQNTFIIGPSIAVKLTWDVILKRYQEDYILIDSLKKIQSIKPKQVVLISYDMLRKYERHIKHFVKINNNKITFLCDESDGMTNYASKRTKVVRNIFRKCKYKLFTTGTVTRNNINEMYSQLELLYNNSINMLCECPSIFKVDPKTKEIKEDFNKYFNKPFPAYFGNGLFKSCFSPNKTTVFGIKKETQDVYNTESLVKILDKTIITRTFFDITGKKPKFETIRIDQNSSEECVYEIIVKEFQRMMGYFKKIDNGRKESMLKIVRQIQMLIKSCSTPQFFKEYNSTKIPGKQLEIYEQIEKYPNEKIAVGTIFKHSVNLYYNKIRELHPDRQVFLIEGKIPFKKRKIIIAEFEATKNGILICTQQSLSSSVSIPGCNKVIIESLPWNIPKLGQFFMRFIRFDSDIENKLVIFAVYNNTIEMNLLALLFDKQRLNEFIKFKNFKSRDNIFKEYNIDFDLMDTLMEKVKDKDNKIAIAWGKQKII
jgi:predicted RNA methylase